MIALTSCTQGIFENPYGNKTLSVDTLNYDHTIISDINVLHADASGNKLIQNKVGEHNGLEAEFMIKFTNFVGLNAINKIDSIDFIMNEANIIFYKADYWGDAATYSFDVNMINTDSAMYWTNLEDASENFDIIEGNTSYYSTHSFSTDEDSTQFPIDLNTIGDWHVTPDTGVYVNNGFTVTPTAGSQGMMAFYAADASDKIAKYRPRLEIQCTLTDTNGTYLQDSTFVVYAGGDLQKAENELVLDDGLFYMSQGNICRAYISTDSLRSDSLLGPTDLLNRAELTMVISDSLTEFSIDDTLQVGARLFRSDYWESDSISYNYTAFSNILYSADDTIKINISQLVQYLISNPKEYNYEGLFFFLNNEYYDFNRILIDPKEIKLDIVYTKVNNE